MEKLPTSNLLKKALAIGAVALALTGCSRPESVPANQLANHTCASLGRTVTSTGYLQLLKVQPNSAGDAVDWALYNLYIRPSVESPSVPVMLEGGAVFQTGPITEEVQITGTVNRLNKLGHVCGVLTDKPMVPLSNKEVS